MPKSAVLLTLLALLCGSAQAAGLLRGGPQAFLPADEAFVLDAVGVAPGRIEARWLIAPGYYLYRHRLSFELADGQTPDKITIPDGAPYHDEHFGEVEIYRDELRVVLEVPEAPALQELKLGYQGCAEAGLCYPPETRQLSLDMPRP